MANICHGYLTNTTTSERLTQLANVSSDTVAQNAEIVAKFMPRLSV